MFDRIDQRKHFRNSWDRIGLGRRFGRIERNAELHIHRFDFEVAIQMRPSNLTVWPDAHVQKQNDLDVDRIMEEFALHEFTTAVIPPL